MKADFKRFKRLLIIAMLMLCAVPVFSQTKHKTVKPVSGSKQLIAFYKQAAEANIIFTPPKDFKEIKTPDAEDFAFDYAMELPGQDFEMWFAVKSLKDNWAIYNKEQNLQSPNPDSLYNSISQANAIALTGGKDYFVRVMPDDMLAKYNADAGKSYLLTLLDMPATKHYKYALMLSLQKNHTGVILAVCFTNEKDPEFFKNINKAGSCLKFKS
jgi:hypothetical protein